MMNTTGVVTTMYMAQLTQSVIGVDESAVDVAVDNPQQDAQDASMHVFAFYYYKLTHFTAVVDGQVMFVTSDRHIISKRYFIDGRVLTIEEIRKMDGVTDLLRTMESNGWKAVVRLRYCDKMMEFDPEKDEIISSRDPQQ